MAALAQEVADSTPELKAAFGQGLENILSAKGGDRKEAIFQAAAKSAPYKWWDWHDNYEAESTPNAKWVEVSGAKEATFSKRQRDRAAKA